MSAARPPRPAATVVLVRPAEAGPGWELFLVQRASRSPLLAGYWVFPGGTLRPDDYDPALRSLTLAAFTPSVAHAALSRAPGTPPESPGASFAYHVAAARELFEEAGILLGSLQSVAVVSAVRAALEAGEALPSFAAQHGLRLDLAALTYYGHWITPEAVPQRFDTRFFLAELPSGQAPVTDGMEVTAGVWMSPAVALANHRAGNLQLHFATLHHLQRLAAFPTLAGVLGFARTKPVITVMPPTRATEGSIAPFLPEELAGVW